MPILDGSSVTRKAEPGDVDLVSHLDGSSLDSLDEPDKMNYLEVVRK
jgi:hypothetical protein